MRPTDDGMSPTTIRRSPRAPPTGRTHAKTRARTTPDPTRNRNRNQTRIRPGDPTKRTGRDARPPTRACAAPGSGSSPDCSRACPASSANPGAPADRGRHARRPAHAADENEKRRQRKGKREKEQKRKTRYDTIPSAIGKEKRQDTDTQEHTRRTPHHNRNHTTKQHHIKGRDRFSLQKTGFRHGFRARTPGFPLHAGRIPDPQGTMEGEGV